MRYTILALLLFMGGFCWAQNLVPNGDFEQYDTCQTSISQLYRALYWTNPIQPDEPPFSTPDYFHSCNPNPLCSMPVNAWGDEYARSGIAYAAIVTAIDSTDIPLATKNYREYLQTELLDTLEAGAIYCISFYVSAWDTANFVSNNMGVYFSNVELQDTCHRCCLSQYMPQFENTADLSSRTGWTKISGTYNAIGDEKYMVIGNFRDSNTTVTTYTNPAAYLPNRNSAGYYVDDVLLMLCDTATSVIDRKTNLAVSIFPNPSSGIFYVQLVKDEVINLEIFDAIGNLVYQRTGFRNRDSPVNISDYSDGIYLLRMSKETLQRQVKLIKQ